MINISLRKLGEHTFEKMLYNIILLSSMDTHKKKGFLTHFRGPGFFAPGRARIDFYRS